jgi:hypothetical protein
VHPAARPTLSLPDQEKIRARLALVGTPIYVAVLPTQALAEAGGDATRLAALVGASVGRPGTYLVAAGGEEGAGSNTLAKGAAANRAKVAFREHPDLDAAILDFIGRVEDAAGTPPATAPPAEPPPGQEDADGDTVLMVLLAVAGVVALAVLLALARESRSERRSLRRVSQFAEVKAGRPGGPQGARRRPGNLNVDLQAEQAGNPRAVNQYTRAYEQLERAEQAFEQARSPDDIAQVSNALESGRFAMAAAQGPVRAARPAQAAAAVLLRHPPRPVGQRRRLGAADRPAPAGPACEACMRLIAGGVQPQARRVRTGLRRVPFYDAPPHFESWFGGYFGGAAADLVAGFPLGKALDDGFVGGLQHLGRRVRVPAGVVRRHGHVGQRWCYHGRAGVGQRHDHDHGGSRCGPVGRPTVAGHLRGVGSARWWPPWSWRSSPRVRRRPRRRLPRRWRRSSSRARSTSTPPPRRTSQRM